MKTKEQLLKDNALLEEQVKQMNIKDLEIRRQFTGLLGGISFVKDFYGQNKDVVTFTWLEIAFKIGELESDANYSCTLQARDDFRNELFDLKQRIRENDIFIPEAKKINQP